jgi:hypothetical protein
MNAVQFFLRRYAPVHRAVTERLLTELDEAQIRRRPVESVNSVAWIVWHTARGEDIGVSRFVAHRPQLFFEEAWGQRLNVPEPDLGTGMTAAEVADLSARVDLAALRTYWDALEQRTRAIVERLRPEDLDAVNTPAYIQDVVEKDQVFRAGGEWAEGAWMELPDRSKGHFLGYLGLTHSWVHLSEAMVTRTLMGLPGR